MNTPLHLDSLVGLDGHLGHIKWMESRGHSVAYGVLDTRFTSPRYNKYGAFLGV